MTRHEVVVFVVFAYLFGFGIGCGFMNALKNSRAKQRKEITE